MLIAGTFEHSLELEEALISLENMGILRQSIMVIPMDTESASDMESSTKSRNPIHKAIEIGMAFATAFSVIGTGTGFRFKWGPIFGGWIFAIVAFMVSFSLCLFISKQNTGKLPKKLPEVTVLIQCHNNQTSMVTGIMWKSNAITVGKILERQTSI